MKLILKNSDTFSSERLSITFKEIPCLDSSWHYHAQYELIYIAESFGMRYVGDNVSRFFSGELVLIGPNLPHLWRNDLSYYAESETNKVKTVVIKFTKDFIGSGTFDLPEFSKIKDMLEQSKYGIKYGIKISKILHQDLIEIINLSPAAQSIKLMDILMQLSIEEEKNILSVTDMRQYTNINSETIDEVIKYISNNYAASINLDDVASVACMTSNSFCRFFKKMTNKTFSQFLNEVRIRNATRLLMQQNLLVSDVCYMVGYKSITNFNVQFKKVIGVTPTNYRETF